MPPTSSAPFSLDEFSELVALALDTDHADRLSESLLQFGPGYLAPSNTCSSHYPTVNTEYLASPGCSPSSMRAPTSPTSSWAANSPSRSRKILDKIKRQASAFVLRSPEAEKPHRPQALQPIPTFSPYTGIRHTSGSSFFDDDDSSDENENVHQTGFTPYVPLATQYERAHAAEASSSPASSQPQKSRPNPNPALSIFSRPSSSITSPPPSPKSTRSSSSTSSFSPITPTTPHFPIESQSQSPASSSYNRRWSLSTDDSSGASSTSYPNHPFAIPSEHGPESEDDPFAKSSVQVVRHSTHSQGYQYRSPKHRSSSAARRRRTAPAPSRPPPSGPLPTPPSADEGTSSDRSSSESPPASPSDRGNDSGGERRSMEWTLGLGKAHAPLPVSPTPTPEREQSAGSILQGRERAKVLRIRVVPSTSFDTAPADKDWTLSLPLGVSVPRSPLGSPTLPAVSSVQPRTRTRTISRTRSFLSHTSADSDSDARSKRSQCPSSWHLRPSLPTHKLPYQPTPRSRTSSSTSQSSLSPASSCSSRASQSSSVSSRPTSARVPKPPSTADSTTSNVSTESTSTIVPSAAQRERDWEQALATLTGPAPARSISRQSSASREGLRALRDASLDIERARAEAEEEEDAASIISGMSGHSGTYYSARSSFGSAYYRSSVGSAYARGFRASVGSAYANGGRRVRGDSAVLG
ncbi:hypothetical protein DXG03_001787 [Asterophora parasitica]|uniref:Uncharacterized protein n=1 Tax=Asterophora parasitica TaxID=117018 RepID=A0A9P7G6F4_9AGAR|nr:hypothetical protein DXG03_001787 [Asterophora parasitica]